MQKKERKYVQVMLKADEEYRKFEKICKELGLKKATIISKMIQQFNKNPEKFLFN